MPQKSIPITIEMAREVGTKDGRSNHPPEDFDGSGGRISDFEKQLSSVASRQISEHTIEWQRASNNSLMEMKTLVPDLLVAAQECSRALRSYQTKFGGEARPEPKHKYTKWAYVFLGILFVIEAAVNVSTFRILREPGMFTYVLGIGLSILAPLSGFRVGRVLKAKDNTWVEWAIAIALFVAAAGLIWVIAEGRELAIQQRGLEPAVVSEAFWIFLIMNIILFFLALWDGHYTGSVFPKLQKRIEEFRKRKREYTDRWGRLNDQLISCLGEVRQLVAEAHARRVDYQQANREARFEINAQGDLPVYFSNDSKLPIEYPNEIKTLVDETDPATAYRKQLLANDQLKFLSEAETAIASIDEIIDGKSQ